MYVYNEKQTKRVYEIYVTDRLKAINDSIAERLGGMTASNRYADILDMMLKGDKPEVTAEQVISSISDKLERLNNDDSI